jgi:hypothetical protein
MNFDNLSVYLAGAMQYAHDCGVGWRDIIIPKLINLGIQQKNIHNPCRKPSCNLKDDLDLAFDKIDLLKTLGKWQEIERISKNTIKIDFKLIEQSDIVIAYIDRNVFSVGTIDEIRMACTLKKPVLIITPGGLPNASYWLVGMVGWKSIFNDDDALIFNLECVKQGSVVLDRALVLFDKEE